MDDVLMDLVLGGLLITIVFQLTWMTMQLKELGRNVLEILDGRK